MVFTIHGKHSHSCMGLTHSIHCAMIQLTRAVGCRYMRPTPTNTRQLILPIERNVVYPVRPVTRKVGFFANEINHSSRISLVTYFGSLLLSVLFFQVRRHSPTLQICAELCIDHQTVADWSQFCFKAMLNFILIGSLQLILMVVAGGMANLWK